MDEQKIREAGDSYVKITLTVATAKSMPKCRGATASHEAQRARDGDNAPGVQ